METQLATSERTSIKGSVAPRAQDPWCWRAIGPGLLACLADTDAGCLIVAAQSGAKWGYSLLPLQILLIPVLYMTQELTIRLGVCTGKGQTACIKEHFGSAWAWFTCLLLVFECTCAMTSEISGVAIIFELWNFSRVVGTAVSVALIVLVVLCFNYRQIEVIGVTLGMFELTFVFTMLAAHPNPREVFIGSFKFHADSEYFGLVAANIGAVIMPWMIYFQQSAVVARRITRADGLAQERVHTLFGSILTQLVMIGALVSLAATSKTKSLSQVKDIIDALQNVLPREVAKVAVSLAFIGGSLCAAFVVSLAASWAVCEALGHENEVTLDMPLDRAPHFYGCFLGVVLLGSIILVSGVQLVRLNVFIELINGMLLPYAVGFLFLLATGEVLPEDVRVTGFRKWFLGVVFVLCASLSFATAVLGLA